MNFNLKYIKVIYIPYLSNSSAAAKASQVHLQHTSTQRDLCYNGIVWIY